jgi:hypothetical protein
MSFPCWFSLSQGETTFEDREAFNFNNHAKGYLAFYLFIYLLICIFAVQQVSFLGKVFSAVFQLPCSTENVE